MLDHEAQELRAEVLAQQAVLMSVFRRMASERPELTPLFRAAFDAAETALAGVATKAGLEAAIGTTTGALRIIGELRAAVLRDPDACRD